MKNIFLIFSGLLLILIFFIFDFYRYFLVVGIKIPYYADAFFSHKEINSLSAYNSCVKALKNKDFKKALKYITYGSKNKYKNIFIDEDVVANILKRDISTFKKIGEISCNKDELCKFIEIYTYDYKIEAEEKINLNNQEIIIKPGNFQGEMRFMKNIFNKWQIIEL